MSKRVLYVEDDADSREATILILERNGWEVVATGDGRDALRLYHCEGKPFNAILLDVQIPGMNGYGVGLSIRIAELSAEDAPRARHVYVTGYASPVPPEQLKAAMVATELFVDKFLVKPISPEELLKALSGDD